MSRRHAVVLLAGVLLGVAEHAVDVLASLIDAPTLADEVERYLWLEAEVRA